MPSIAWFTNLPLILHPPAYWDILLQQHGSQTWLAAVHYTIRCKFLQMEWARDDLFFGRFGGKLSVWNELRHSQVCCWWEEVKIFLFSDKIRIIAAWVVPFCRASAHHHHNNICTDYWYLFWINLSSSRRRSTPKQQLYLGVTEKCILQPNEQSIEPKAFCLSWISKMIVYSLVNI